MQNYIIEGGKMEFINIYNNIIRKDDIKCIYLDGTLVKIELDINKTITRKYEDKKQAEKALGEIYEYLKRMDNISVGM